MTLIPLLRVCFLIRRVFRTSEIVHSLLGNLFALIFTRSSLECESIEISASFTGSFSLYPLATMPFHDKSIEESISRSVGPRR